MKMELEYKSVLNLFILITFICTLFFMFAEQSWAESKRFGFPTCVQRILECLLQ